MAEDPNGNGFGHWSRIERLSGQVADVRVGLAKVEAQLDAAEQQRREMARGLEELKRATGIIVRLVNDVGEVKDAVAELRGPIARLPELAKAIGEMEPEVEHYKRVRQRLLGAGFGLALGGGGLGVGLSRFVDWIAGKH